MSALDLALVSAVVGGALWFLATRFLARRRRRVVAATSSEAVVGASLARGLEKAKRKHSG